MLSVEAGETLWIRTESNQLENELVKQKWEKRETAKLFASRSVFGDWNEFVQVAKCVKPPNYSRLHELRWKLVLHSVNFAIHMNERCFPHNTNVDLFFLVSSQLGGVNTVVSNNTLVSIKTLLLLHQAWYHSRIIYLFVHCANRSISVFIPFSDFILVGN